MIAWKDWSWRHTFSKQRQVKLDNLPIKPKYRLKVFLNDVPGQVCDNHDFYFLLGDRVRV